MKVKYISDDGHEFTSKAYCQHYEDALEEIDEIDKLASKVINGVRWFKINSVAEFYFFDHMDDTERAKSGNTMYEIAQLCSNIDHRFPFWITKDMEGQGIMIDKKRHQMIDGIIEALEKDIEDLKQEKEELLKLRSSDLNEDTLEYKSSTDQPQPPTGEVRKEGEKPTPSVEETDDIKLKPFMEVNGKKYQLTELMRMTMESSEYDEEEWAELSNQQRNELTKQKIKELQS